MGLCKFLYKASGAAVLRVSNKSLDSASECLRKKGVSLSEAVRNDWGTYEVRLGDADGNKTVTAEFA